MRIPANLLDELIENEGELKSGPVATMGVLRLALDLRDARRAQRMLPKLVEALQAMLAHTEPNCGVTSTQSVWNVARRVLAEANNPEVTK
jgi:hypothetical protein